jgi:hypothetical protein
MKRKTDLKLQLEAYTSTFMMGVIVVFCLVVMVVNFQYIIKLERTIDTMWHEIIQVKETNIGLYQFIEDHKYDFN